MNLIILTVIILSVNGNYFNNNEQETKQVAEKVYLHIDRVNYNSGDDIWFKAYIIDPLTNKLSINTNNLHVELIAPDSKIILSRTLKINGGVGNGDFHLNDSIPSGQYRIRAYTNHMRNYDDHFFFLKEITIINPYDDGQELNRDLQKVDNKIDISFFPEGGSLVDNVTSTVAFKAVNALGKGCDVTVKLFSSSGDLITIFNSTHLGMGFFNIKPVPGLSYYTIVKSIDGSEIKVPLPQSFPLGVTIRTFVTPDKKLILTVNTNEKTLPSVLGKELIVHLSSRNLINKTTKIKIDSLINNFIIPVDSLPDGIIRITLSGNEGLPLCERLVYFQKNNEIELNVVTDKKEYKPREKVSVGISLSGNTSFTGAGDFSYSAAEARFTDNSSQFPASIASWFLLESDVRGQVEEPSYYFDPSNKKRFQDLDLLLMTQGWRDFQWKYDTLTSFKHEIGFTISGNVKRILNNKPIEGIKINMGLFANQTSRFLDTNTDRNGIFKFEEIDIPGKAKIFISATGKFERMQGRISVDSIKYEPPEGVELKTDSVELVLVPVNYFVFQQEAMVKLAIKKKYKLSDTIDIGEVFITAKKPDLPQEIKVKESRRVYATPDKEVVVSPNQDNFSGDVFEYISGRIPGVRIVRSGDIVKVIVRGQMSSDGAGALILLDGYEIDTLGMISLFTLSMAMVDRIDVLNASPLYGMKGANGVINIITRTGMRRGQIELSANSSVIKVTGFDAPRIFYSPKYNTSTPQAFIPDIRTTIFWEPNISVKNNKNVTLNYFNADKPTTINITVEGITGEGIPLTGKTRYEVK